ncbi:MAG TPA: hypothetical protein VGH42_03655 [Verrucomicrobiae bacterium]
MNPVDVEFEQRHVAVFHGAFPAFHPMQAVFARGGDGAFHHHIFAGTRSCNKRRLV